MTYQFSTQHPFPSITAGNVLTSQDDTVIEYRRVSIVYDISNDINLIEMPSSAMALP